MKTTIFALSILLICSSICLGQNSDKTKADPMAYADSQVVLETSLGVIALDLFPDVAPKHVMSFTKMVNMGFYDSLIIHRAVPDVLIQGGSPDGTPVGKGPWTTPAEFSDLNHIDGTIAMARPSDINGASCQFYITLRTIPQYDGKYSIFGEVADSASLATAHKISKVKTTGKQPFPKLSDYPLEKVYILKAHVRAKPGSDKP